MDDILEEYRDWYRSRRSKELEVSGQAVIAMLDVYTRFNPKALDDYERKLARAVAEDILEELKEAK